MKSIWNGTLSFGLVSIPIKMYSATDDRRIDLDMLDKHDNALSDLNASMKKLGRGRDKDIVKGFKKDDAYIVLEKEDFEDANVKKK